ITFLGMGEYFYINGTRLRAGATQVALFRSLLEELESRSLAALRFMPGLTAGEMTMFLKLFVAARTPEQVERLPEAMTDAGILRLVPVRVRDLRTLVTTPEAPPDDDVQAARARARATYGRAVRGTRGIMVRTAKTGRPALRQAKRMVQPLVDSILKNEYSILGLTALKNHDEYTYAHCVNVSVISTGIGHTLGLSRDRLAHLGVAALLHDLGKLLIPPEVLNNPGRLTADEWTQIRRHPIEGVRMIARMPGLSMLTLDSMRVSLEHHMNVDGGGYPERGAGMALGVLSRIVAVADVFDALTAHRAYRARPFSAYEALELMMGTERGHFDPAVLWSLVRTVSLYPAGTVLRTESGRVVLSLSPNRADLERPFCRVLQRADGTVPDASAPETLDPMPSDDRVVQVLRPGEHDYPIDELLAA
ncbi:MAG TPA: HD-GYP domain-containing protein, partial [Candidatus Eisenbacteria bacterium]